ncbi:MAG TPA: hypothetical protein VIX63_12375 [Vicinamibacterales bacterium]
MTDRDAADERLREAFQALGDTSREEPSAEELDRIWRAVSGDLPPAERRELVDRMAADPALADAWRVAHELRRAASLETRAETRAVPFWTPSWMAAAAVLLIGIAIGVVFQLSPSPGDTFRDADTYAIESLVQPETTLPRDAFRLRWTPGPQDSRYQVRVTTEDLRVLATIADLTEPEVVLESAVLSSVAPGARVLWQVDATLPGGENVSSETFIVRVQ